MRLPFQIVLGYTDQNLIQAQWDLLTTFRQAVNRLWNNEPARQTLLALLDRADGAAQTPQHWIERLVWDLSETLPGRQPQSTEQKWRTEVACLEREKAQLQYQLNGYLRDPLQSQLSRLEQERARWQSAAQESAARVHDLEAAQERARQLHQDEQTRLHEEIKALRRLLVEKQEALNAYQP